MKHDAISELFINTLAEKISDKIYEKYKYTCNSSEEAEVWRVINDITDELVNKHFEDKE